jgi:hypothetical protein
MKKLLIILSFTLLSTSLFAQKIAYTVDASGFHIQGVDGTNPVIYDNDIIHDTPEVYYLWLKANRKEVNLVGNIATRDMHPQGDPNNQLFNRWIEFHTKALAAGLKNIPTPIRGAGPQYLVKPSSGNIDDTQYQNNAGSDLIIAEARKASAAKPLVIFVGGNVSTIANAYLKDKSIADKIVVLHFHGYRYQKPTYNTMDFWGAYIVMKKLRYINHSGDLYSGYTGQIPVPTTVDLTGMPANSFTQTFKDNWYGQWYRIHRQIADAPVTLYFFNHGMIKNVVRKLENDFTTTSNTFDYLLVAQNDWPWLKGPAMIDYIRNPANYVPVTTPPPVNQIPVTAITNTTTTLVEGSVTLTASASDPDGSVSKVEFFVGGSKVGEDASSPYSFTRSFTPGSYVVQSKATDNVGAVGNSANVTFTITAIPDPEPEPCDCKPATIEVKETITLPPDQPAQVVKEDTPTGATFTFKIPKGDPGDDGDDAICSSCPPGTGTGSVLRGVYFVENYGANGSDNLPDTQAFQDAITAATPVGGEVWWGPASNYWNINNTLQVIPAPGSNQLWISITGHGSVHQMRYTGPSGKAVFRVLGMKKGTFTGVRLSINSGITGVAVFDVVTSEASNSSSGVLMTDMRFNLGNGMDNIGVRLGNENGGNGDISHYTFIGVDVYGGGADRGKGDPIPGQYAFQNLGHNTLANAWEDCFVANCDAFFTNSTRDGTRRGNSAVTFKACGGAHNGTDFVTAWEGPYNIFGGRFENGHRKFLEQKNSTAGKYQQITMIGVVIKDYNAPGGVMIDILRPTSLSMDNVLMTNGRSNNKFTKPIRLAANGDFGALKISGGGILSDAAKPYAIEGNTKWGVTVENVARMGPDASEGNIRAVGMFPNENQLNTELQAKHDALKTQNDALKTQYDAMKVQYDTLMRRITTLENK